MDDQLSPQSKAISPLAPPPSRVLWLGTWLSAFGMGRPAPPGSRRWISRLAHSVADGGGRRRLGGIASASVATFAFRVWLWVLWDDRNGCSCPQPESRARHLEKRHPVISRLTQGYPGITRHATYPRMSRYNLKSGWELESSGTTWTTASGLSESRFVMPVSRLGHKDFQSLQTTFPMN